jgi:hypothetical protein
VRVVTSLRLAFGIAFDRRSAYALAAACGLGMLSLLIWNSGGLNYFPASGWEFYASPGEVVSMLALAGLFGLLVPLQVAALTRARAALTAAGGLAGTAMAIAGVSCCAPLLLPALLSFIGFSGTALLGFNASLRAFAAPLTIASVLLMLVSIGLVSRTLSAACRMPSPQPPPRGRGSSQG